MRRSLSSLLVLVALVALVGSMLGACGDGDGDGAQVCGTVRREPLDRRAVHILPGAAEVAYLTDPPTSGPHMATPSSASVRDTPLDPAIQVGLLEEGRVLLQHTGLSLADRETLEGLAQDGIDGVVVAPAPSLPEDAAVIATAWLTKQVCTEMDLEVLRAFVAENRGLGPGHA